AGRLAWLFCTRLLDQLWGVIRPVHHHWTTPRQIDDSMPTLSRPVGCGLALDLFIIYSSTHSCHPEAELCSSVRRIDLDRANATKLEFGRPIPYRSLFWTSLLDDPFAVRRPLAQDGCPRRQTVPNRNARPDIGPGETTLGKIRTARITIIFDISR